MSSTVQKTGIYLFGMGLPHCYWWWHISGRLHTQLDTTALQWHTLRQNIPKYQLSELEGFDFGSEVAPSSPNFWRSVNHVNWFPGFGWIKRESGDEESFDSGLFPFTSAPYWEYWRPRPAGQADPSGSALLVEQPEPWNVYGSLCTRRRMFTTLCVHLYTLTCGAESWKPSCFPSLLSLSLFLCSMALLPRCLAPARGSACQWWRSATKHCLKAKKHRRRRRRGEYV